MSVINAAHRFPKYQISSFSAIDVVKRGRFIEQPQSFEESMRMKIELAKWRVESYRDSGDDQSAGDEYMYQCGLENGLKEFLLWSI